MSKCEHVWLLSDSRDCAVCPRCGATNEDYSSLRAAEERLRSAQNLRRILNRIEAKSWLRRASDSQ